MGVLNKIPGKSQVVKITGKPVELWLGIFYFLAVTLIFFFCNPPFVDKGRFRFNDFSDKVYLSLATLNTWFKIKVL